MIAELIVAACVAAGGCVQAQHGGAEPRVATLGLLRARSELSQAESAYARLRHLYDRRLVSAAELEASAAARERATLGFVEQWMAVSGSTARARVIRAYKSRDAAGRTVARLRLWIAGTHDPSVASIVASEELRNRLNASVPAELAISVKDEAGPSGAAIGVPYERRVPATAHPREADVEFRLLRDAPSIVIALSAAGWGEERKVWLETDVGGTIAIHPAPYSQEADLGTDAAYDVSIERFGESAAPMLLEVRGLPAGIAHVFTDGESGARIGQLRLPAGEHERRLRLTVTIPESGADIQVDSAYRFTIVVTEGGGDGTPNRSIDAATGIAARAELVLVPRGVARAELRVLNLFHEVDEGSPIVVPVVVRNAGTRAIDRIRVHADVPAGWSTGSDPPGRSGIAPGAESSIHLTITPPADAEIGEYEARLTLDGSGGRARLATAPAVLRVRIRARRSWLTTGSLLVLLAAASGGGVVVVRRLGRR